MNDINITDITFTDQEQGINYYYIGYQTRSPWIKENYVTSQP